MKFKILIKRISRIIFDEEGNRSSTPFENFKREYEVSGQNWQAAIQKQIAQELGCDTVHLHWVEIESSINE